MFEETLKSFEECEFDFAYIARYSVRPGTIASKIYPDDVPDNIKAERWHKLNNALNISVQKRNNQMI
jgi:tRNA-2-methylthio-N6-dimethylallyladenosine synthase